MSFFSFLQDPDVIAGLIEAGGNLAGGLIANDTTNQSAEQEREFQREKLAVDREISLAQIAASSANTAASNATAKEIAKKQIAGKLADGYGQMLSRSSIAGADALKNKDVEIPANLSAMFSRIGSSFGGR